MTQLTEHAKSILRAIADGKAIQQMGEAETDWAEVPSTLALRLIAEGEANHLRIAPETSSINGVVFAAPVDYVKGNYGVSIGAALRHERTIWFDKATDCTTAFDAIIDALNGVTK